MTADVQAAIVNYGTPDLTRMAVWSLHSLYPHLPITVVDNNSPDDSLTHLHALADDISPLSVMPSKQNLHHGPGLDRAIRASSNEWILTFDSDCIAFRKGFLDEMLSLAGTRSAYMVGAMHTLTDTGHNVRTEPADVEHPYVHPKCALVRRATYLELPPFEKHGVPCLRNEIAAREQGHALVGFPIEDYVFHQSRGTVERFGYKLGAHGWLNKLRHHLRRLSRASFPS